MRGETVSVSEMAEDILVNPQKVLEAVEYLVDAGILTDVEGKQTYIIYEKAQNNTCFRENAI